MKNLEDFIRENKQGLDTEEPGLMHHRRFVNRLDANSVSRFQILRWAASFLLAALILSSLTLFLPSSGEEQISSISTEMQEALFYYKSLNSEMESQLMSLPIKDKKEKQLIRKDLQSYDKEYERLLEDLKRFPNDQRILNAMIEYQRSRSDMLEFILYQLNQRNV